MKGNRALRFTSVAAMPESLRKMVVSQEADKGGTVRPSEVEAVAGGTGTKRANKYGNTVVHVDGIRFDSKREARYYERLKLRVLAGEVSYFLRQVPIHLPGGTKLVVDFLEAHVDGSVHFVDTKGRETAAFRIKQREVHHHYPFRIELV